MSEIEVGTARLAEADETQSPAAREPRRGGTASPGFPLEFLPRKRQRTPRLRHTQTQISPRSCQLRSSFGRIRVALYGARRGRFWTTRKNKKKWNQLGYARC